VEGLVKRPCFGLWAGVCQIPWQELGDLFNRMIGNAGKNGSQVEFRIQPVSLAEPISE